ncbi:MarR family winged helix-turn-helix transcriptional regulator [Methylobacterium sp. E-045]|uniref:MarR family winged helix-turn-helix transcriptional regulator n=1 Tax=Methylobacterium sp. E-045 TaxID=2836575 RepID=UPI00391C75A5|nr:MarR family transcriptional regulator [Methylobacterium sp. E-045]
MQNGVTRSDYSCTCEDAPGFLANHVARLFIRAVDRDLAPLGLSVAQISPLLLLSAQGPLLQRDLVRQSPNGQPAMVATLSRLERAGLIERQRHEGDGRAALIALTASGHEAVKAASSALASGNETALSGFAPAQRELAVELLKRMASNLERSR